MIDLIDRVADRIKANGFAGVETKRLDSTTGREATVVRQLPHIPETTYTDRSTSIYFLYQVIVRRRSEKAAMEECWAIADLLKDERIDSDNNSYRFTGTEIYTYPQELMLEEAGFYAWETRIYALIERS